MLLNYFNLSGNAELMKQLNSALIYRLIVQNGPISRIKLAEISDLAPASITKITRQLLNHKLIEEIDVQQSTGGRPAVSIIAKFTDYQTVTIQLSRSKITIELYDLGATCLASSSYPLLHFMQDTVQACLIDLIKQFCTIYHQKIKQLIAISIVMPGLIDSHNGIVRYSPHIKVKEWKLSDGLFEHFGVPIFIGNDVQSLALAENYFGSTHNVKDSILIRVHRGVGSGVIIDQQRLNNHNHSACEVGHIQIDSLGERCHCGNFGCLEQYVMNSTIEERAKKMLSQGYATKLTIDNCDIIAICKCANKGDELAIKLIQSAGKHLAKAVAILVNIFNPQKIVIAGELTLASDILLPAINSALYSQSLDGLRKNLTISCSQLNDRSSIGAFALVQEALFNGSILIKLLEKNQ